MLHKHGIQHSATSNQNIHKFNNSHKSEKYKIGTAVKPEMSEKSPSCRDTCNDVAAEWTLRSKNAVLTRETPIECLALASWNHP